MLYSPTFQRKRHRITTVCHTVVPAVHAPIALKQKKTQASSVITLTVFVVFTSSEFRKENDA